MYVFPSCPPRWHVEQGTLGLPPDILNWFDMYVHKGSGRPHKILPRWPDEETRARTLNLSFNLCLFDRSDHPACRGFFVRPPFEESCEAFQNPHICTYISNLAAYIGMYICMYMQTVPPLALPPFVYIRENMKCLLKPWFEAPSQELRLSA